MNIALSAAAIDEGAWIDRTLEKAVRAFRLRDYDSAFSAIDAVLGRRFDQLAALRMGLEVATQGGRRSRMIRYGAMLLALDPRDPQRRVAFAATVADAGAPDVAAEIVALALRQEPVLRQALAIRIRGLIAARDHGQLDRLLDRLTRRKGTPVDADFVEWVGSLLAAAGESRRALDWLAHERHGLPEAPSLVYRRAQLTYEAGDYSRAERLFATLETDPDERRRVASRLFQARIAHNTGRPALARRHYGQVHAADPANPEPVEYLVRYALGARDIDEARSYIARLEAAAPEVPQLVWLKASLALATDDAATAIGLFRDAIARAPKLVEHHCRLADMLADIGDFEQMGAVLNRALEIAPASPRTLKRLLRCAQLRRRPVEEILDVANRILAIEPADQSALLQRANCLLRLGSRAEALEQYVDAAKRHPSNVTFWRSAVSVALSLNQKERTLEIVEAAKAAFSGGSAGQLTRCAEILEAAELTADALAHVEAATRADPGELNARRIAGRLSMNQGHYDQAWPHLVALRELGDRTAEGIQLYARAAAAFRFLRPSQADLVQIEPNPVRLPERRPLVSRNF